MIPRTYGHVGTPVRFKGTAYDFGHPSRRWSSLDDGEHRTRYETPDTNDYQNLTFDLSTTRRRRRLWACCASAR